MIKCYQLMLNKTVTLCYISTLYEEKGNSMQQKQRASWQHASTINCITVLLTTHPITDAKSQTC